jgi:hypothetical protein
VRRARCVDAFVTHDGLRCSGDVRTREARREKGGDLAGPWSRCCGSPRRASKTAAGRRGLGHSLRRRRPSVIHDQAPCLRDPKRELRRGVGTPNAVVVRCHAATPSKNSATPRSPPPIGRIGFHRHSPRRTKPTAASPMPFDPRAWRTVSWCNPELGSDRADLPLLGEEESANARTQLPGRRSR